MKTLFKRILPLLLVFALLLPAQASGRQVQGAYAAGVVTVTASGLSASTTYSLISVTSPEDIVAFSSGKSDASGALSATITTGALDSSVTYQVHVYADSGALLCSGSVTFQSGSDSGDNGNTGGDNGTSGGDNGNTGGDSGSSGGSSEHFDTTISTNPDGSATTTKVDKTTGAVTETTRHLNGTQVTQTTSATGQVETTVELSKKALDTVQSENSTLPLPIASLPVSQTSANAPTLDITASVNSSLSGGLSVEIPVQNVTPGTVAILVHADGTEEVLRNCLTTENGLKLGIDGDVTIKVVDNAKTFEDVEKTDWHSDAVDFVSARQLFNGTSETTFEPDTTMTRGMFVTVLHSLENNPETTVTGTFSDLKDDTWYTEAVEWAADAKVISGYGDGTVGAEDIISREQLAVMLWNYAGKPSANYVLSDHPDANSVSAYAYIALSWSVENGIINGVGNGFLNPGGQASRAEAAQMLMRFMNLG